MNIVTPLLALGQAAAPGQQNTFLQTAAFVAMVSGIFYFIVILPTRKKQKQHTEMLGALKSGDKVITSGGIHGTVVGVSDSIIQLRIADQVKIDVARSAIADVRQDGA